MCVRSRYKSDISGGLPVMSVLPYMSCDVYYTLAKCPESPNFRFDIVSRLVYNSVYKREWEILTTERLKMSYFQNQEQLNSSINDYANTSPKYRGDELNESEKQRIRNNIANSRNKLAKMSEIEKTALTLDLMNAYKLVREW